MQSNWRKVLSWETEKKFLLYFGFHSTSEISDYGNKQILNKGINKVNQGTLKRSNLENDYGTDIIEIPVEGSFQELVDLMYYLQKYSKRFIFPSTEEDISTSVTRFDLKGNIYK